MTPRKRKPENEKLPPYVYRQRYGVMVGTYDPAAQKVRYKRLCGADATLAEIWAAYEGRDGVHGFEWLAKKYQKSADFKSLAENTRRNYAACHKAVCAAELKSGKTLGEIPLSAWSPGVVRKYLDHRMKSAPVRAAREKAYISVVFGWAYQRDMVKLNPARGVKVKTPAPSRQYVTDGQYVSFYQFAAKPEYVRPAMEIGLLCAARLCEVLDLTVESIRDDGLFLKRRKGSRDAVIEWSPALKAAVDEAKRVRRNPFKPHLFQGSDGERLRETSFQTAWQRLCVAFEKEGGTRFGFHRLKAKRVSDAVENKQVISGHKSSAMVAVYDLLPLRVKPER